MTSYQVAQLVQASLYLGLVALVMSCVLLAGPRKLSPVIAFGVLTGVLGAGFFVAASFAADRNLSPLLQVAIKMLRDLPAVLVILYACKMQLGSYSFFVSERGPSYGRRLEMWFDKSTSVVLVSFFLGGVAEFIIRPDFLDSDNPLPPAVLVSDGLILFPLAFYAALACYVFAWTLTMDFSGSPFRGRLENLCGVVALGGLSLLAMHTLGWRALRALLPVEQVDPVLEQMSLNQIVLVAIIASSIALGLVSHSTRDGTVAEVSRKFVWLVDKLSHIAGREANTPVRDWRVRLCYEAMMKAAGPALLDLEPSSARRARRIFRGVMSSTQEKRGDPTKEARESRKKIRSLMGFFDRDPQRSMLYRELGRSRYPLSGALRDLLYDASYKEEQGQPGDEDAQSLRHDMRFILELESQSSNEGDRSAAECSDDGVRLSLVALRDAGMLTLSDVHTFSRERALEGEVSDAYYLAKYEVENSGLQRAREARLESDRR